MLNFIIDHSKLIVGICVILFGFSTIPIAILILETSDTKIATANLFDYFIWFVAVVYILSGVLFSMFGASLIEDYTRKPKSYR
jgi:hypothetical protein|tara:strand:+ start:575 stop:823 length:249 start_codon:yes stop_codon:yes gene_type:complete